MSKRSKKPAKSLFDRPLQAGDTAMLGGGSYSCPPGHYFFGRVLWVDESGDTIMVERSTLNGERYVQQLSIYDVRAYGDYSGLRALQDKLRDDVKPLTKAVDEATSALGMARDALDAALKEMSQAKPEFIAPDLAAEKLAAANDRRIQEIVESEEAAANHESHLRATRCVDRY